MSIILRGVFSCEKNIILSIAFLVAILGTYVHVFFACLLPVAALGMIWFEGKIRYCSLRQSVPLIFLLLLLIWMGLSIFWTENQAHALKTFIALSLTFVWSFFLFSSAMQASHRLISTSYDLMKYSGLFLIVIIIAQFFIDTFFNGLITYKGTSYILKMKPLAAILGLAAFVGCAFLWIRNKKLISILIFFLLAALILLTKCQTALYSLLFASAVFGCSYLAPVGTTYISALGSYTFLLLSPLLFAYIFPSPLNSSFSSSFHALVDRSLLHRWVGWEYYAKKFFEKPLSGWGLESSRVLYLPDQSEIALGFSKLSHPHNNSIQIYAELGIVGGILYALFFASLFYLVAKHIKDRFSIAVCNATISYAFLCAEITHSAWRTHWLSAAALTAGLVILFLKVREGQLHVPTGRLAQLRALLKEWEQQQSDGIGNHQAT